MENIFNKRSDKFSAPLNRWAACKKQMDFIQRLFHPTGAGELGLGPHDCFLFCMILTYYPLSHEPFQLWIL